MRYQPGDKVRVIDSQNIQGMKAFIGKICTIKKDKGYAYELEENRYVWAHGWLELVPDIKITIDEEEFSTLFGN